MDVFLLVFGCLCIRCTGVYGCTGVKFGVWMFCLWCTGLSSSLCHLPYPGFVSPTMHPLATTRSFTNNIQVNITDTIATLTDYW